MTERFSLVLPPLPFIGSKDNKIPLGAGYVYSHLKKLGFKVNIVDLNRASEWRWVYSRLKNEAYEYMGFTGTSAHRDFLLKASQFMIINCPDTKTVLGGPVAMAESGMEQYFDLVVDGPIETMSLEDFGKNGHFVSHALPDNLDDIVKPERRLFLNDEVKRLSVISSRYCPYSCNFCFNSVRPKRESLKRHSVDRVLSEIMDCIELGYSKITFQDDTFILNRAWAKTLFTAIVSSDINIEYDCRARVDLIDDELLRLMNDSGCSSISYGVESGSQKMLDIMNKGITPAQSASAIIATKRMGIKVKAYIILGVPGETVETINETKAWLDMYSKFIDKLYVYMWIPYPGSKLYLGKGNTFQIVGSSSGSGSNILGASMFRSSTVNVANIRTDFLKPEELESQFNKIVDRYSDITGFD